MSEPTYRIELRHEPENGTGACWHASVYAAAEYDEGKVSLWDGPSSLKDTYGPEREVAFHQAQAWCKAKAQEPLAPSTVFLTEDGDIHDPFDTAA